jgi:hypothetical protein
MTTEETTRQAAWQAMSKKQRIAWLRSGNVLSTTSSERQTAVAKLKKNAGGR